MNRLPFELIDKIFDLLSMNDICELCLLNQYWHTVTCLKIYKYPLISSEKKLGSFVKIGKKSKLLIQVLDLTFIHQQYITDTSISSLLQHVNNLKRLNLSKCIELSPNTILSFIQNNIHHLNTLQLANCTLSTEVLYYIGKANHQKLKLLDLGNTMIKPCISIDTCNHLDKMIFSPPSSSQLIHLDLSFCAWVDSQTIENITHGLPKLEHILLQWCNQIKPKYIKIMVKTLVHLESIDLRHIDMIASTEQAFSIMQHGISLKKILFTCKTATTQIVLK